MFKDEFGDWHDNLESLRILDTRGVYPPDISFQQTSTKYSWEWQGTGLEKWGRPQ